MTAARGNHDPAWWTPERRAEQGRKVAAYHQAHTSPLTWADVRKIRAEIHRGGRVEQLGRQYGVSAKTIESVAKNVVWHDPEYEPRRIVCRLPECDAVIVCPRAHQHFCCKAHQQKHNNRIRKGYYARRAPRCAITRHRATLHERARCGCPRCVDVLVAAAQDPIGRALARYAGSLDHDDLAAQALATALAELDRFAALPSVMWDAFVYRLVWKHAGHEHARRATLKRGGDVVTLRLDQPLGDDGAATLGDIVAASGDDPCDELERRRVARLLEGLTLERVAAMRESELEALRAQLAA